MVFIDSLHKKHPSVHEASCARQDRGSTWPRGPGSLSHGPEAGEWLVGVVGASNLQAKRLRSLQESSQTMVKRLFTPIDYRNRSSDHKYIHKPLLGPYRTIIYAKKPCEHQTIPLFRPTQERSGAMKIALKISSEELNRC